MEESVLRQERKKAGNVIWVEQVLEEIYLPLRNFVATPELNL